MSVKKNCSKCKECKSISCFYKQKNGLYERTAECKECRKNRSRTWGQINKEQKNSRAKISRKLIDRREEQKIWREKNPFYFKEYYKQNREIRLECNRRFLRNNPERYEFYKIYNVAKRKGLLINPNQCQVCGVDNVKIFGHHFDYTKPLQVTWLCRNCHNDIHKRKKFTVEK